MHLSVGIQLPSDLIFDIDHYRGQSPSSSGSTTPEGLPSGCRSPILEPICEGKTANLRKDSEGAKIMLSAENLKPIIKVSSADNLISNKKPTNIKPILKHSSNNNLSKSYENFNRNSENGQSDEKNCTKSCENFTWSASEVPKQAEQPLSRLYENLDKNESNKPSMHDYENLNFLRNDSTFVNESDKLIGIERLHKFEESAPSQKIEENLEGNTGKNCNVTSNQKPNKFKESRGFLVPLRKVPKNFTRNQFLKEHSQKMELDESLNKKCEADDYPTTTCSVRDKIKFLSKKSTFEVNKPNQQQGNALQKLSNLSLQNMNLKSNSLPSSVTQKFVNNTKAKAPTDRSENLVLEPSTLNEKYCSRPTVFNNVESSQNRALGNNSKEALQQLCDIPDIVSSTLNKVPKSTPQQTVPTTSNQSKTLQSKERTSPAKPNTSTSFWINRSIFRKDPFALPNGKITDSNLELEFNLIDVKSGKSFFKSEKENALNDLRPPIFGQSCSGAQMICDLPKPIGTQSSSVVKNIIQSLNHRDSNKIDFRNRSTFGRSSLKVIGNPKVDIGNVRSSSPEEFTAL